MEGDYDPKYTEICSAQTVQSNDKGFFNELYGSVRKMCPKKWIDSVFRQQIGDRAKIQSLFGDCGGSDILLGMLEHVAPVYKQKNAQFSAQRRREGEKLFDQGDTAKALILLSQAVLRAPDKGVDLQTDGGISLAFALWARSAVLLEMGNGPMALSDLQYSLACGLPAKQHGSYYLRLAQANALSGARAKADICIKLAERLCQDSETLRGLEKLKDDLDSLKIQPKMHVLEPELSSGENPDLHSASNLIQLSKTKEGGQFIIAKDNVKTGDVILVEKPVVSNLLTKFYGTHCLHCLSRLIAPYGCSNCSGVAFCSLACKEEACSTYHPFECHYMDLLIGSGMSVLCFLALRLMTQSRTPELAIANGRKLISDLCTHSDRRLADDYLQRCTMSAFLLRILQKSEFFGRRAVESAAPTPIELEVCEVLLGILQVLQFNAHEIYETKLGEKHRFVGSKAIYIGVALYKTGAYFNHDCHPALSRYFVGTSLVLCAGRSLQSGELVGENYGPIFTKKTLAERRRALMSRYWFKCECQCCRENWQVLDKLSNQARLRCPTPSCHGVHNYPLEPRKSVKCAKCRKMVLLQEGATLLLECEEYYRRAAEFMDKENTDEAIREFSAGIDLFYTIAIPPHKNTQIAQESLRVCLADHGSVVEAFT